MDKKTIDKISVGFKKTDYIKTLEASQILGVTQTTLRRWHHSGKFKAHIHPVTGYLFYKIKELHDLYAELKKTKESKNKKKGLY
jgi:predicted site-specific integrase-resolvase